MLDLVRVDHDYPWAPGDHLGRFDGLRQLYSAYRREMRGRGYVRMLIDGKRVPEIEVMRTIKREG